MKNVQVSLQCGITHLSSAVQAVQSNAAANNRGTRGRIDMQHNYGVSIIMLNQYVIM